MAKFPANKLPEQIKKELILDYKKYPNLFDATARGVAAACKVTTSSQMRNFYEYVLDYYDKSSRGAPFDEILPFIKMLNSKVAYAKARQGNKMDDAFVEMIEICVAQVENADKLRVFKLFFEAVMGFAKR